MFTAKANDPGALAKALSSIPRRRGGETCLLVCPTPPALWMLLQVEGWRHRFDRIVAWVIDSYWLEWMPWLVRRRGPIDAFFVTNREEVELWARKTRRPCHWLPWGTDALGLGSRGRDRPIDLIRVGRQPPQWDRDTATAEACSQLGLTFEGRPPGLEDPTDNMRMLMGRFGRAKFSLCFSNRVNPTNYTHPSREYVTARWLDALAAGSTPTGVHPRSETARALLRPGGVLELGSTERDLGLGAVAEAARTWDPEVAERNNQWALQHLDWRLRFEAIARVLGTQFPALDRELAQLRGAVDGRRQGLAAEPSGTDPIP
jgi:hypothetical protein